MLALATLVPDWRVRRCSTVSLRRPCSPCRSPGDWCRPAPAGCASAVGQRGVGEPLRARRPWTGRRRTATFEGDRVALAGPGRRRRVGRDHRCPAASCSTAGADRRPPRPSACRVGVAAATVCPTTSGTVERSALPPRYAEVAHQEEPATSSADEEDGEDDRRRSGCGWGRLRRRPRRPRQAGPRRPVRVTAWVPSRPTARHGWCPRRGHHRGGVHGASTERPSLKRRRSARRSSAVA